LAPGEAPAIDCRWAVDGRKPISTQDSDDRAQAQTTLFHPGLGFILRKSTEVSYMLKPTNHTGIALGHRDTDRG
jgi:hypothetical protein